MKAPLWMWLALVAGCGGRLVEDRPRPGPIQPPECVLPVQCLDQAQCILADGTEWRRTTTGYLHQETLMGVGEHSVPTSVVSTLCAIDEDGNRVDR